MIKDSEECFEDLAKSYPELIEKSQCDESLGVDVGWFNIIDALCGSICQPLTTAKSRLKAAIEYPRNENGKYIAECTERYNKELEALPIITTIKEKFAGLRVYVENSNDRVDALIGMASLLARHTCEVCGKPGELDDTTGWMKIHCKDHFGGSEYSDELQEGKVSPIFQDDET